eukprot:TRINITY_DN61454_c0_g1_i1.p1 TRINITY_DN61454_c0_g1~~TRINITY_DN61454_c0_g1_i1.p1  ORF type:complete len:635 (-),score=93.48 TRINITY_DN61454_c0_g1_i1:76-1980(-)
MLAPVELPLAQGGLHFRVTGDAAGGLPRDCGSFAAAALAAATPEDVRPPDSIILSGPDYYKSHVTRLFGGYKRTRNLYGKATYQKDPDQVECCKAEAFIYWSAADTRWCVSEHLGAAISENGSVASGGDAAVPIYQVVQDDGPFPRLGSTWVANLWGVGARYQAEHMLMFEALQIPVEAADPTASSGGYMHICTRRFLDYAFPPNEASLEGSPAPLRVARGGPVTRNAVWASATDAAEEKSGELFRTSTEPRGDWLAGISPERCGIMPLLAAVREYPGHLESLFTKSLQANPLGFYEVWLYDIWVSSWRQIVVDDFIPMVLEGVGEGSALAPLAGGHARTLWASLMVKALAKLCGSFEALRTSEPGSILMALTGQPHEAVMLWVRDGGWWSRWRYLPPDVRKPPAGPHQRVRDARQLRCVGERLAGTWHQSSELFLTLRELHRDNALIYAYADPGREALGGDRLPPRWDPGGSGLVIGLGYSVLQFVEVDEEHASVTVGGLLLVQLRNIWGAEAWRGPWSEGSNEWERYPEVRRHHLRSEQQASAGYGSGRFWMAWTDFCDLFDRIQVCPMQDAARKASYAPPQRTIRPSQRPANRGLRRGGSGDSSGGALGRLDRLFNWECCAVELGAPADGL